MLKPCIMRSMTDALRIPRTYFSALGRKGGSARSRKLTPEQRTAIARKAGIARARKAGQKLRRRRRQKVA